LPPKVMGLARAVWDLAYGATLALLWPANRLLAALRQRVKHPDSVLHVSYMVHIPYYTVAILRRHGMKADYLAVGRSPTWDRCDFRMVPSIWPPVQALKEFLLFWRVVARYEVLHSHFMITMSHSGWELPLLKRMGRRVVIHYRGCEIRQAARNRALHPEGNICQECDYGESPCTSALIRRRRALAEKYGDAFLVTTPDLRDFAPRAEHFPFFAPEVLPPAPAPALAAPGDGRDVRIVHATNHPGIEGTPGIRAAVERLKARGYPLRFEFLRGVSHEAVLKALAGADLAIGKMKMGYYANAQIESMALGVPTITWVRPEFMTDELRRSGFIFTTLEELEATLAHYLDHPEELAAKRQIARESILRLHDNDRLAGRLVALYRELKARGPCEGGAGGDGPF